jgi:hypothetical protein
MGKVWVYVRLCVSLCGLFVSVHLPHLNATSCYDLVRKGVHLGLFLLRN